MGVLAVLEGATVSMQGLLGGRSRHWVGHRASRAMIEEPRDALAMNVRGSRGHNARKILPCAPLSLSTSANIYLASRGFRVVGLAAPPRSLTGLCIPIPPDGLVSTDPIRTSNAAGPHPLLH